MLAEYGRQHASKTPQGAAKRSQDASKTLQDTSKTSQIVSYRIVPNHIVYIYIYI